MPPLVPGLDASGKPSAQTVEYRRHIFRDKQIEWHVEICGRMVHFTRSGVVMPKRHAFDRKPCGVWSMQSRMKLLRFLNRIDYPRLGPSVFVTLTYPDECLRRTYKERSDDRKKFVQMMEYHLGREVACLWRIEWEERKSGRYTGKLAPHFHLMVFNVGDLDKSLVRGWWRKAIGRETGPLATKVLDIYNEDGVCRYLSKYVSKYRPLDIRTYHQNSVSVGRAWGLLRKSLIPMCRTTVAKTLDADETKHVKAFALARNKWFEIDGERGFTLFGEKYVTAFTKSLGAS